MSLLTMVQSAVKRIGIATPVTVVGNTDRQIVQLLEIANEEGQELSERNKSGWQALEKEATFTTVATESQGALSTLASGYRWIVNDTIWNRTTQRPVYGPLSVTEWQLLKASPVTGPFDQYRIRGNELLFNPVPSAGDTCAFEYITSNWCETSGGTGQDSWQADDDVGLLDEKIMAMGIIWRWKQVKGFDYAEDYAKYERRVMDAMATDSTKPILRLDGEPVPRTPGIFIPQTGYGS